MAPQREPLMGAMGPTRAADRKIAPLMTPPDGSPIMEGVTMMRGDPGSGIYGEKLDLRPRSVTRFNPMSVGDAQAEGLIDPSRPSIDPSAGAETPGIVAAVRQMRVNRDKAMSTAAGDAMGRDMDATRTERWGASGPTSAVNRRVQAIRDQGAAQAGAQKAAAIRTEEARNTPQAVVGSAGNSTWNPVTGKWESAMAERGPAQKQVPQTWDEYTPEDLSKIVNDTVGKFMSDKDSATFRQQLMMAGDDEKKRAAVYEQFASKPTPEQRIVLDNAMAALRKKSITKDGSGSAAGGSWKDAFKK